MTTVYEHIAEVPGPHRLGRHLHHDERSRAFPAKTAPALKTVRHRHYGAVLDQGNLGSCTGNAVVDALMTAPLRVVGRTLTETDAVSIYERATQLDPFPGQYPPDDTGSDGLDACKAAKEKGLIGSYAHAFGIDQALHALVLGPEITGTNWMTGMDTPDANGLVRATGSVRGGHEYCAVGLDVEHQLVWFLQSWGKSFGKAGFFCMSWSDWDKLLKAGGDVTVPQR